MTKRRAERLTGYEISRMPEKDSNGRFVYAAFRDEELIAQAAHLIDERALQALVREVLQATFESRMVGDVQGVVVTVACKFIIASTGRTEARTRQAIWSPCAGTVTG